MSLVKWIKEHVRPHVRYDKKDGDINLKKNSLSNILNKAKDKLEIGIKFRFKF